MSSKYQLFAQYPSLVSVLSVLKSSQYASLPEVNELLTIYNNFKDTLKEEDSDGEHRFPFIVLEGLDGCGKSHTSKDIAKKLNAVWQTTPPKVIGSLREKFDMHDSLLRRAYYSLGNYIAELDVKTILRKQPVIMDRFWHSTAAYGMANELIQHPELKLPPEDDELYYWPKDLIKPDLIVFLTTSEEVRLQRLSRRKNFTQEEDELKKNAKFRDLLNSIYKNMKDPQLLIFDNSYTPIKQSVDSIVTIIKALPVS